MSSAAPVFLTGFMATGKSKIGRLLASRMRRIFIDTDQMIEARAGKAIAAIFADEGEESFRALERECVVEAASREAVIALGGGAIAQEKNLKAILSQFLPKISKYYGRHFNGSLSEIDCYLEDD